MVPEDHILCSWFASNLIGDSAPVRQLEKTILADWGRLRHKDGQERSN